MYRDIAGKKVFFGTGSASHVRNQPSIVFIHGAAMDHTVWTLPARYFARHDYNVVAVDLPGHGRSTGPALESVEAISDWLSEMLASVGEQEHVLVGHSMGSLIAWDWAAKHSNQCKKLVLLGTSMPMPVTDQLLDAAKQNEVASFEMANTWSHSSRGKLGFNPNPGVWMFGHGQRLMHRSTDDVFYADLAACNDANLDPAQIQCPALLILGESDQMTPYRAGRTVADQLTNASVVTLPGSGHSMLSESPNEVLDALIRFLSVN
ncbi:MAG: alpha/beta hydrolase [Gammaproteobacteria bacterium]|nr:alpha/beta hydrolase [Gammaproteobacteria bacterium]